MRRALPASMKVMKVKKVMKVMKVMKVKKGKKVMKVMKVMKVKKVKKVMKVSTIAKGKKAKVAVWQGKKLKTSGGLKKEDLVKSSKRKIVSASRSQQGKKSKWAKATAKARAIKGYTGFKPIKKGTSFYEK